MKNVVEIIILCGLVFILGMILGSRKDPEIIEKPEYITVEGEIKYKTIEKDKIIEVKKPYALVITDVGGDWHLDQDLSYIPGEMTVDSIKSKKQFDWVGPARVGFEYNFTREDLFPVIGYAPLGITLKNIRLEIGALFNTKSVGLMSGARWRNTSIIGSLYLDGSFGAGLVFRF